EPLAATVLGQRTFANPTEVQVSRIEQDGAPLALLVQSPEPIDWSRTTVTFAFADRSAPAGALPGDAKLTDVTFGSAQANGESVSVLLRNPLDLTRYRIEQRMLPDPLELPAGDPTLLFEDFGGRPSGRLYTETFGPNALDLYTIVDQGAFNKPSQWTVAGGS